jgi:riboflavin kinase/FMN adenylyltransferase
MKVLSNLSNLKKERKPITMAVGFFDGVHVGHRRVIGKTIARAKLCKGTSWVLTFDMHPANVVIPNQVPPMLTSVDHKLMLLDRLAVDGCVVMPFTRQLSSMRPEAFITQLIESSPHLSELLIGKNWRFGKGRKGTPALLKKLCSERGINVTVVSPATRTRVTISSTGIRKMVTHGDLTGAESRLGRPFSILANVKKGRTIGRTLGFPTANLEPENEVVPPCGVYAVRGILCSRGKATGEPHDGILNFGTRPTFKTETDAEPVLEAHFFDINKSLYGRLLEVSFVTKIRQEKAFASREGLKQQIAADIVLAKKMLANR